MYTGQDSQKEFPNMHVDWIWLVLPAVALAIVVILVYLSRARRRLLRLRIDLDKTWAGIDALLKQRYDEIPKLLGTCRGYMPHDHPAFEPIARARADYLKARTLQEKALANVAMAGAIKGLFKIAGDYQGLKSNNSFVKIRKQNFELEENIEEQQELFNEIVKTHNRVILRFPDSMAARKAHLQRREPIPVQDMGDEA
jgi:LemA protein